MATIEELLNQLNLGKHIDKFHAEDIDLGVAKSMSEAEFKGAGLTIGAAKKLYEALHGNQPAAAAAAAAAPTPAAAATAARPTSAAPINLIDVFSWKWAHAGKKWPSTSGCSQHDWLRLEGGSEPKSALVFSRCGDEQQRVVVMDVEKGSVKASLKQKNFTVSDADIYNDLVCGSGAWQGDSVLTFWDAKSFAFSGEYRGPNEGGLARVTLNTSSSGAMIAICNLDGGGRNAFQVYDVAGFRCTSKPIVCADVGGSDCARRVQRDPHQPGCFVAAFPNGKVLYIDLRTGSVVRNITVGNQCKWLRLPDSTPSKGIVAHPDTPVYVFDIGTGRTIHSIEAVTYGGAAMASNIVTMFTNNKFVFYDINGAPAVIAESSFALAAPFGCCDMDMAPNVVVGLNSGNLCSAIRA